MSEDTAVDELLAALYHAHFVVDEPCDVERLRNGGSGDRRGVRETCDEQPGCYVNE